MDTREKNRGKKATSIDRLEEVFSTSTIGVLTDYRGLTTGEMNDLRHKLDSAQVQYQVVKNTLARFAAEKAGRDDLVSLFQGPIAIAFSHGEITGPAKVLSDYIRANKSVMSIKGGFISGYMLTAAEVEKLATLPSREVLIAKMLGGMQSPITMLVNCLANPLRGMLGVLQARINQLEGG
ncbi:50S ribosomal protein L10 [Chloroflexota bacterium]